MEILAPAGSYEKLVYASNYHADAVYCAGEDFSLRNKAQNLSRKELAEAVCFLHNLNKKIYITVNIYARNEDLIPLKEYLSFLASIKVDALIISDPGVFSLAKTYAPNIPLHISTQANITNYEAANFWHKLGASRIILARELSLKEISEIKMKLPKLELEIFVHGAMCISYSGRCLLSSFLNKRSANQGLCTQVCRWGFAIAEKKRENEYFVLEEDKYGTYILNSKDLCLIDYLKQIEEAGVCSIKIEGRMKSVYYTSNLSRMYKKALEEIKQNKPLSPIIYDELSKISHRTYSQGFINGDNEDMQNYDSSAYIREYQYVGKVLKQENGYIYLENKAKFFLNDEIEFIFPEIENDFKYQVFKIYDENKNEIEFTKPNSIVLLPMNKNLANYALVRIKISS